jgi:methylated-DNA-[protein]-cysteine S-methyltransferase
MGKLLDRRYTDYRLEERNHPHRFTRLLQAYLAGDLSAIADIPVSLGGTPFQQQVWLALRSIPVGMTMSYQQLAIQIGNPQALRAVGMANSQNPIAIILPCHRVIGSDGNLTGYAGGLDRKLWLLEHERRAIYLVK